jgi:hypothetical protein
MNKQGPIIIIEDNAGDQRIFAEIFKNLNFANGLYFFTDGLKALEFINRKDKIPFLIISEYKYAEDKWI